MVCQWGGAGRPTGLKDPLKTINERAADILHLREVNVRLADGQVKMDAGMNVVIAAYEAER